MLGNPERNLFGYLHHALLRTAAHLGLETEIRVSSTVPIDHDLTGQDKVLALCEALGADTYVNPIGGVDLYSRRDFAAGGSSCGSSSRCRSKIRSSAGRSSHRCRSSTS